MSRVRIKFCGIRRPEDALAAAQIGADAIGMVFHPPARRNVPIDVAREILRVLPPFVTPVGLFVDRPAGEILDVARTLGLRHIQLHGNESVETLQHLADRVILKAVKISVATSRELALWRDAYQRGQIPNLRAIILETGSAGSGGSGIENDWELISQLQRQGAFEGLPPIVAAGGLSPANVAQVVRAIRPWAVDVSSGIEEIVGEKSVQKMRDFYAQVQSAA